MSDLVAFLKARLDEDEHLAQMAAEDASAGANWHVEATYKHSGHAGVKGENGEVVVFDEGSPTDMEARHIASHDPARVLREVEAKRARLAEHQADGDGDCTICVTRDSDYPWNQDLWVAKPWPCPTVRSDAAIYSDHPDYDPAWAPAP